MTQLTSAQNPIAQAQQSSDPSQRRALAQQAIATLDEAGNAVATIAP